MWPKQRVVEALAALQAVAFCRNLTMQETTRWGALLDLVTTVSLSDEPDRVSWHLNASGRFSVESLYHKLCQGMV